MTSSVVRLGPDDGLYYEYDAPAAGKQTFVFVNALTGSTAMWQAEIGPALRRQGYGTLAYNFRGQTDSPFAPGRALDQALIVGDLRRLLAEIAPPRPVLVGLSIGGLFATWAILEGAESDGVVLINTLRRSGPRLAWVNAAMAKAALLGGTRLVMDLYMPLLVNEERSATIRRDFLTDAPYEPLDPAHGHANLMANAANVDWDPPWEQLAQRTLVLTGLQDRVFLDPDDVASIAARIPDVRRLDLADAGHLIPVERPAATISALADFTTRLERS